MLTFNLALNIYENLVIPGFYSESKVCHINASVNGSAKCEVHFKWDALIMDLDRCRDGFRHLIAGHVDEINVGRLPILAVGASCDSAGRNVDYYINIAVLRCLYHIIRDRPIA